MVMVQSFPNMVATDNDRTRKQRRPTHTFSLRHRPFVIQPFMCAPVLPGETLTNFSMQSRVVADPVKDKMTGAHCEYFFFYVKLRDLDGRDDFEEMMINPSKDMSAYYDATDNLEYYYDINGSTTSINYAKLCYQRVVTEHFRGDDEDYSNFTDSVTGLSVASVNNVPGWLDSLTAGDNQSAVDVTISTAGDNAFTVSELQLAMNQYQLAKMHGLTQKSFEDYLRDSGVMGSAAEEPHLPELLFMQREWTYPTNAVEPTDGSVASSWVWSNQIIRSNRKMFTEPGFILGVTVVRPKVYYANLTASPHVSFTTMNGWLPPELRNNERAGQSGFNAGTGPAGVGCDTESYRYYHDDLFLFGDQWANYAMDGTTNSVALPVDGTNLINIRYPTATDINALFVDDTNASGLRFIRQDGIINMSIMSYLSNSFAGTPISAAAS